MKKIAYTVIQRGIKNESEAVRGAGVYYHCLKCGGIVSSFPKDNCGCPCENIFIDIDHNVLEVRDYPAFESILKR